LTNILVPMAGNSQFFAEHEHPFPKPLVEIAGKTIVEHVVNNLSTVGSDIKFIFIVRSDDCRKYHLDLTLDMITRGNNIIIRLDKETQGSACSALMAIEFINNEIPLLIANDDQLFVDPISQFIASLGMADAGVVCFESVHPRWSYVRVDERGNVMETAEKRPITRNAIAGLYYFCEGKHYVNAAMKMIEKRDSVNGNFYVAPALNQMILDGYDVRMTTVVNDRYHTLYSPQKIREYELRHVNATAMS
jgi:dTDP-glucose pyrophosphorylase